MCKVHKHNGEQNEADTKEYMLNDSIYMKFRNK